MVVFLLIAGVLLPAIGIATWITADEFGGGGGAFCLGCLVVAAVCVAVDFKVYLPRHWNAEMSHAMSSLEAQSYPQIESVSMDPWLSVTFAGCGEKFHLDTFSGRYMPYIESGGDGVFGGDGTRVPLSPYYVKTQYGCGQDGAAS